MELGSKVEEVDKEEERSKREMEIDKEEGEERKRSLERPRVSIPPPDNRLLSEKESSLHPACSPWSSEHPGRRDSLVGAGCRRTDFQTCNYRLVSIIVIEQSSAPGKNLRLQLTR